VTAGAPPRGIPGGRLPGHALRAGVVGAGWIGQRHAETLAARDDVVVAAVCDTDPDRAAQVAAASGAQVFSDWRAMLDGSRLSHGRLDVLWVCTPPLAHVGPAVAALDRGLPVYLEKPIARTVQDAALIVAAAERGGAVCAIGYQWRAIDVLADLQAALAGRTVGCLVGQSIGGTTSRPWFLSQAAGGGNLLERGSHHLDLARAIAGEVVAVQAAESAVRLAPRGDGPDAGDISDAVTLLLHFEGGGLGTIVVAWISENLPGGYWLEVTAADAALRLDLDPEFRLSGIAAGAPVAAASHGSPFAGSVDSFLAAVRARDPGRVLVAPADAARTLAVAAAAEAALGTGGTVAVSY
jgi:myo-inositol 2-dehydrogenase/D-chiro-inositol 1-dehydrogenase